MSEQLFHIERLGNRGEGVARSGDDLVFVPYALAGETVRAERRNDHARLLDVIDPSPDRVGAICPHYGVCGGCAVQTLAPHAYAAWKRDLVVVALRNAGLELGVAPLIDAHGAGRRRATFHARMERGQAHVGFMRARSHDIIEIDACPLLAPGLEQALPVARALAQLLAGRGKPLDIVASCTQGGLDVDLRGAGALGEPETLALMKLAARFDLARLSNHGALIALRRKPSIAVGDALVIPPSGGFLQATEAGEQAIATLVLDATQGAKRVADLFCGIGAFALRLARTARVCAYDNDAAAIAAMQEGARGAKGLRLEEVLSRDLFRRPLTAQELGAYDAVVFDPPRAGAEAQAREIARSTVRRVVAVSCNAQSFARDARLLLEGGYQVAPLAVTPIDQFRFSPHVEMVAVFSRAPETKRKRALLSR